MVELYRVVESSWADEIENELKEMVIAHRVIVMPTTTDWLTELPALKDEGQYYYGQAIIKKHLAELAAFVEAWRKYQSDSCYVDATGICE